MKRNILIVALVAAIAIIGAGAWQYVKKQGQGTDGTGGVQIGGPFSLTDHNGKAVTEKDYAGKYLLVFFGYTFCPDVCPTAMQTISEAMDLLGEDGRKVQPLFISIDPERDTPAVLKEFVSNFHPSIIGLTGTPEQIAAVAKAYRVYYARARTEGEEEDDQYYLMNHSAVVYLIDPDGKFIAHFAHTDPPEQIAAKIRKVIG